MTVVYAALMSLIVCSRFGWHGLFVWAVVWCVLVFRAASSRRSRGGEPVEGMGSFD